jgi:hypothetical protein
MAYERNYERIAARFQQRIAETVAKYEADIILLQDEYESMIQGLQAEIDALTESKESAKQ